MSGRDHDRRRHSQKDRHRHGQNNPHINTRGDRNRKQGGQDALAVKQQDKNSVSVQRPRWTAPKPSSVSLPVLNCARCGQSITDLHIALANNGVDGLVGRGGAVHFDCVIAELSKYETLDEGETLSYIGGGRFGIVRFAYSGERTGRRAFFIKKIFEWENKEKRAEWRGIIADHYSMT